MMTMIHPADDVYNEWHMIIAMLHLLHLFIYLNIHSLLFWILKQNKKEKTDKIKESSSSQSKILFVYFVLHKKGK